MNMLNNLEALALLLLGVCIGALALALPTAVVYYLYKRRGASSTRTPEQGQVLGLGQAQPAALEGGSASANGCAKASAGAGDPPDDLQVSVMFSRSAYVLRTRPELSEMVGTDGSDSAS